jgi:hypothetical protein
MTKPRALESNMNIWKAIFGTAVTTAVATVVVKGIEALSGSYGANAKMQIANGVIEVTKGDFSSGARTGVQRVIRELEIEDGWIEVRDDGRIAFSTEIPESVHQRLRNILQNA